MKKCFWMMAIAAVFSFAFTLTSCGGDSDDPTPTPVIIPVTPAATGVTPGATFTDSCDITFPFALDTKEVTAGKDITSWMVQNFNTSARASETVIESLTVKIRVVISETAITVDITGKAPAKTGIMSLSVKVPKDQTKDKIEVSLVDNIWSKTVINPQPDTKLAATISFKDASVEKTFENLGTFAYPVINTGDGTVTYTSSKQNVALVDSSTGVVTMLRMGETKITATVTDSDRYTYATKTATYTLRVVGQKQAASISFAETSVTKGIGDSAFTNPITNTGDGAVTYTSSNVNVATVNESTGEVTIHAQGTAKITATVADSSLYTYATKTAEYTITVSPSYLAMPLTLEATAKCTITFLAYTDVYYSLNGESKTKFSSSYPTLKVNAGDKVAFYASISNSVASAQFKISNCGGKKCYVYGNVMSLLGKETAAGLEGATSASSYAFVGLFSGNKDIDIAEGKPLILPATTVSNGTYQEMFKGCTGLTRTPEIRASKLGEKSCYGMFSGCTALTETPYFPEEIAAGQKCFYEMFRYCTSLKTAHDFKNITLDEYCCWYMFADCSALTKAPALPATTLKRNCYDSMFLNCTSLQTAPDLPAEQLDTDCYSDIFKGCSDLRYVKCLMNVKRSDIWRYFTTSWMQGAPNYTTCVFVKNKNADLGDFQSSGYIPSKWKIQDAE